MNKKVKKQPATAEVSPGETWYDDLMKVLGSDDFHGFSCCGHSHPVESEAGILWNDAGHRTQIERAIWILSATEPGSVFHSLWSFPEFRKGFFNGLWAADYRSPYNNFTGAFGAGTAIYTSHFFNPENYRHIGFKNAWLLGTFVALPLLFENFNETAYSMAKKHHQLAADFHHEWRENHQAATISKCGFHLGVSAHYFTDLTQPMHAANFANAIGFEGSNAFPNTKDKRHSKFENMADDILNNPDSKDFDKLICNPAAVKVDFSDSFDDIVLATARASKDIFDRKVKGIMTDLEGKWDEPVPYDKALLAYEEAFPKGQIATARFLEQWARFNTSSNQYNKQVSDWVAVSERYDTATSQAFPCMFYRQDGDLKLVFRFFNDGKWIEDKVTFADFARWNTNSLSAFASCFDKITNHPVLFVADKEGKLYYWHVPDGNGWKKIDIKMPVGGSVKGAIACTYDERYKKPCAVYRGENGLLHYVYWNGTEFSPHVPVADALVGGAISVVWEPPVPNDTGHIAVSYIDGSGRVNHMHVRSGKWARQTMPIADKGTHADPQMIASVYDAKEQKVGIFWGLITYSNEIVPESSEPELKFREQAAAQLKYTIVKDSYPTSSLGITAVGGISATTQPNVMVHYCAYNTATRFREGAEFVMGQWVKEVFQFDSRVVGNIAAADSIDGTGIVVASRTIYRDTVIAKKYTMVMPFKTGDTIALLADNMRYLATVYQGPGIDPVRAVETRIDTTSRFVVGLQPDGHLTLLAGNQKYLSRVFRDNMDLIEAQSPQLTGFSKFAFTVLLNGQIAMKADNGKFLRRYEGRDSINGIEAINYRHDSCAYTVRKL